MIFPPMTIFAIDISTDSLLDLDLDQDYEVLKISKMSLKKIFVIIGVVCSVADA